MGCLNTSVHYPIGGKELTDTLRGEFKESFGFGFGFGFGQNISVTYSHIVLELSFCGDLCHLLSFYCFIVS
jgi:hypothetical protein